MAERKSVPYKDRKFDRANAVAYSNQYRRENFDQVNFVLPKGYKQIVKDAAAEEGLTMSEWIRNLIDNALENK